MKPRNKFWRSLLVSLITVITTAGGMGVLPVYAEIDDKDNVIYANMEDYVQERKHFSTVQGPDGNDYDVVITYEGIIYSLEQYDTDPDGGGLFIHRENYLTVRVTDISVYSYSKKVSAIVNVSVTGVYLKQYDKNGRGDVHLTLPQGGHTAQLLATKEAGYIKQSLLQTVVRDESGYGYDDGWTFAHYYNGQTTGSIELNDTPQIVKVFKDDSGSGGGMTAEELETWYRQEGGLAETLDKLIETGETTITPEVADKITETQKKTEASVKQAGELETELTETATGYIEAIDPKQTMQTGTPQRLIKAFEFVRSVHAATIERTAIKNYIGFVMILGLAAYIIGRRGG